MVRFLLRGILSGDLLIHAVFPLEASTIGEEFALGLLALDHFAQLVLMVVKTRLIH
jgi:hypothetical protein